MASRVKKIKPRKPASLFIPSRGDGEWSPFDTWLRAVLEQYMMYREITKPLLSADGQPVLDSFNRPRLAPDAPPERDKIKKGAVWFTRETLRTSWYFTFGTKSYREMNRHHYDTHARTREANAITGRGGGTNYTNYSHPMDHFVRKMTKDHRLIKSGNNRFMLSQAECIRLKMPQAWETHRQRGLRWENLIYDDQKLPASVVLGNRRRAIREDSEGPLNIITMQVPVTNMKGVRHAHELQWREVLAELRSLIYFDIWDMVSLAKSKGLVTDEQGTKTTSTHLSRWLKQGKIKKVLPKFYQAAAFDLWNRTERGKLKVRPKDTGSWFIEYLKYWTPIQQKAGKDSYFTSNMVIEFYGRDENAAWMDKHYPDGLQLSAVRNSLTDYRKQGYLVNFSRVGFRAADDVMRLFTPIWRLANKDDEAERMFKLLSTLHDLPISEAIAVMPTVVPEPALYSFLRRIETETPDEMAFYVHLQAVAKRIKVGPMALFKQYQKAQGE